MGWSLDPIVESNEIQTNHLKIYSGTRYIMAIHLFQRTKELELETPATYHYFTVGWRFLDLVRLFCMKAFSGS